MDNRLKFLYRVLSELWGHRTEAKPGNEKTGASAGLVRLENPFNNRKALSVPNKSREVGIGAVKKSRYCVIRARTVNRHRWMRRES